MSGSFSLVEQYRQIHADPARMRGGAIKPFVADIAGLVYRYRARTLLDYGCAKGTHYFEDHVHRAWGGLLPYLYDPAVKGHDTRPEGARFDGVICTDVLEHVPEDELDPVVCDVMQFAGRFAFFSIATRPANATLPDGRNAHVTVRDRDWWVALLARHGRDGVELAVRFST